MPEAIIDWRTGYFDKISLFVYANIEKLFQEGKGKGSRKNTADQESVTSTTGVSVPKMKPPFSLRYKEKVPF